MDLYTIQELDEERKTEVDFNKTQQTDLDSECCWNFFSFFGTLFVVQSFDSIVSLFLCFYFFNFVLKMSIVFNKIIYFFGKNKLKMKKIF